MKGMELPINVMVIVVICLIVLIAIAILFFGVWNPFQATTTLETAKNNACQLLVSMGCTQYPENIAVRDFDANRNGASNDVTSSTSTFSWPGNPNRDCYTTATSGLGDNLASLCICYYNLLDPVSCRETLCSCSS